MMKNISSLLIAVAVVLCGISFAHEHNTAAACNAPAIHRHAAHNGQERHATKRGHGVHHKCSAVLHKHGKAFCFGKQTKRHAFCHGKRTHGFHGHFRPRNHAGHNRSGFCHRHHK